MNRLFRNSRTLHRFAVPLCALPLLVTIVTGIFLLLKSQLAWVQPSNATGSGKTPTLAWESVLEIARRIPEAEVKSWKDIAALDVRPTKGVIRIRAQNSYEIQIDSSTGAILSQGRRFTALLISLHEGTWFGESAKYAVFLPSAILLLLLCLTGLILFIAPYVKKHRTTHAPKTAKAAKAERV